MHKDEASLAQTVHMTGVSLPLMNALSGAAVSWATVSRECRLYRLCLMA